MTEPDAPRPLRESEAPVATSTETPEKEPEPAPEPWTPERVTEWNAYYDMYVALGLLLLTFVVAANRVDANNAMLWTQLRAGMETASRGAPLTTDVFSYTEPGRRWVNIPWLFEWSHFELYRLGHDLLFDKNDPGASAPKAEQLGVGILVALNALARVLTAVLLLGIRRAGPGRWWSVVCVALALGSILAPSGVEGETVRWGLLGGIARPGQVTPGTWGLLLLALELVLLFRALELGKRTALYGLIPVFLLWANLDESFLFGLAVLAGGVFGLLGRRGAKDVTAVTFPTGLAVLAGCAAVCLINPSVHRIYPAALSPLFDLARGQADPYTFFGKGLQAKGGVGELRRAMLGFYLVVVAAGFASFALNRRLFPWSRFLIYSVAAVLWGVLIPYQADFALVFAVTLALNGQEWYQARFGTSGRVGTGWTLWSVGGRAVTIVLLFLGVALGLTGYGSSYGDQQFGFGYNPDHFEFEAADYLKSARIKGNVLNWTYAQGDSLIWRASPQRPVYIDDRQHLYPQALLDELQAIRTALKFDTKEQWQPLLDKHQISVVMIDEARAATTYQSLSKSPNWVPFYDDGNVILFGRTDAAPEDVALFRANRLDAGEIAFRRTKPVPAVDRPPTQVGWLDEIFHGRSLSLTQPHTEAANRWLKSADPDPEAPTLPDPAHCFAAIREARTALSKEPDDSLAFRILSECYRALTIEETALLRGFKLTPENLAQLSRGGPQSLLLMNRFRQRVTALNFAVQTTPPPRTDSERRALQLLNNELYQLYLSMNYLDLARDRLPVLLALAGPSDLTKEVRDQLSRQLSQLNEAVKRVQDQMNEQQEGPLQRAAFALRNGAPGLALQELEEADRTAVAPKLVKPQLLDLYCDTGQPDKALEQLGTGDPDDPALGVEPGHSALRQSRVSLLLGNYENAAVLLQSRAIPETRYDRTSRALTQAQGFILGSPLEATSVLLTIPTKIATQASWEFELGMCLLEGGIPLADANHPTGAADHLTNALTLEPTFALRPVIAYYLEMMGKPVPPLPESKDKGKEAPSEPKKEPTVEDKPPADKK